MFYSILELFYRDGSEATLLYGESTKDIEAQIAKIGADNAGDEDFHMEIGPVAEGYQELVKAFDAFAADRLGIINFCLKEEIQEPLAISSIERIKLEIEAIYEDHRGKGVFLYVQRRPVQQGLYTIRYEEEDEEGEELTEDEQMEEIAASMFGSGQSIKDIF